MQSVSVSLLALSQERVNIYYPNQRILQALSLSLLVLQHGKQHAQTLDQEDGIELPR